MNLASGAGLTTAPAFNGATGSRTFYLHELNLNEVIRVLQLKLPLVT